MARREKKRGEERRREKREERREGDREGDRGRYKMDISQVAKCQYPRSEASHLHQLLLWFFFRRISNLERRYSL